MVWMLYGSSRPERFGSPRPTSTTSPVSRPYLSTVPDVSTVVARLRAYSLLLNKGLIRVGRPLPAHAEFTLVSVHDPYGYASARQLSLFRRPLPTTNLPFLSTEMWDGRETIQPIDGPGKGLRVDLGRLVHDVALGPEQGTHAPAALRIQQIVSFELGLFTTQVSDTVAGDLASAGALGGPQTLYRQPFYIGINDPLARNLRAVVNIAEDLATAFLPLEGIRAIVREAAHEKEADRR